MKKFDIVAFGEILIDFTSMGKTDEGQKLFAQNAGGAPANVLVCATKFGKSTAFIGKVGNDMHGRFLIDTLNAESVNTDGLICDDKYFTTLAFVSLNEKGERSFSFARNHGADTKMSKDDINSSIIENCKIFHVGSLSLTTPLGQETTEYAIAKAKEAGAYISYDPNYRASLWKDEKDACDKMRSLIKYADFMKISDEECLLLTGESDVVKASNVLNAQGVRIVCVTLGSEGAYCSIGQKGQKIAGFVPQKVADTTGAGDSFWGGFLNGIVELNKPNDKITLDDTKEIVRFANATASLCVEQNGAIRAMPTLQQVKTRLNQD